MTIALLMNVALVYAILVGGNLPAPLLGIDFEDNGTRESLWFETPGYVIPLP